MCPLRRRSAQLLVVAWVLPLAAIAGCAADPVRMPTGSIAHGAAAPAPLPNPLRAILVGNGALSEAEAEAVIARATAAHEMYRP